MKEHKTTVARTAHYATYGEVSTKTKYFIVACHGYGQLAKRFIRKFDIIASDEVFVLAPEGLSRFYWGGLTGDVVASWMTREDRLDEIADYTQYIQQLYEQYTQQLPVDAKIILLGFSQGCATVMRWVMHTFPKCDYFAFWGGMIPEDLDYTPHLEYFNQKEISFFYGDQDHLITPDRLDFMRKVIVDSKIQGIKEWPFSGGHTIDRPTLKKWFQSEIEVATQ